MREVVASLDEAEPVERAVIGGGSTDSEQLAILDEVERAGWRTLHQENRKLAGALQGG